MLWDDRRGNVDEMVRFAPVFFTMVCATLRIEDIVLIAAFLFTPHSFWFFFFFFFFFFTLVAGGNRKSRLQDQWEGNLLFGSCG